MTLAAISGTAPKVDGDTLYVITPPHGNWSSLTCDPRNVKYAQSKGYTVRTFIERKPRQPFAWVESWPVILGGMVIVAWLVVARANGWMP